MPLGELHRSDVAEVLDEAAECVAGPLYVGDQAGPA